MRARLALTAALTGGLLLTATGGAAAQEYGPEWQPGPDYSGFEPGPDYTGFEAEPDQEAFEPGYAPGTADLLDGLLSGPLGGLLGR